MQKTTFPVKVLIHDDASTDKTADIVREYEQKFPHLIKAYYQKENSYTKTDKSKRRAEFGSWRTGKYQAVCEGDDYWIDPYKLQKQVDFLENNPEYGMCYTKALIYSQVNKKIVKGEIKGKKVLSLEELIMKTNTPFQNLTICLRKDLLSQYSEEIKPGTRNWISGDTALYIWFYQNSKIYFIDEITGIYRRVSGSASHPRSYEGRIKFHEQLYRMRIFYIELYHIPELKTAIDDMKFLSYAHAAIAHKKYSDYSEFIAQIKSNTWKIKLKKMIGRSKFLMIMCYYYLKFRYRLKIYFG
jgi:glycosyltransferase involved in cell wall biosynthesis